MGQMVNHALSSSLLRMNEKAIVTDWMFVVLENSHAEVLTPRVVVFGDGASEVIKIKWGHKDGALIRLDLWPAPWQGESMEDTFYSSSMATPASGFRGKSTQSP